MRGIRQIVATVIAVAIAAGGTTVFACPVCFGAEETKAAFDRALELGAVAKILLGASRPTTASG